ncbi:hypothetical protein AB0J52_02360 [Spirillospora sp. NPDC049652]
MAVVFAVTGVVAAGPASAAHRPAAAVPATDLALAAGENMYGQLGTGAAGIASQTLPVDVALPAGVRLTQIAACHSHSLGLTSDGRVLAWGNNGNGQLGDGTTTQRRSPAPVAIPDDVTITQIACGSYHSMALTSGGRVLAWGRTTSASWATAAPPTAPPRCRWRFPRTSPSPKSPAARSTTWP